MAQRELDILVSAKGAIQAAHDIGKVDKSVGSFSRSVGRAGKLAAVGLGAGVAVGAALLVKNVRAGVESLAELEQITKQTEAVIASTGGKAGVTAQRVGALAEQYENLTTVDDKVIRDGENMLLTFTGIGKDVFPQATKAMVDMSVAMAGGDASAVDLQGSAIMLGKALNDPVKGVSALRKVGVALTKEQEESIKKFVKQGKVAEAQKIILKELGVEFGKAGEAAGKGAAADLRRWDDAVEGAQQALATGFLPVLTEVRQFLTSELAKPETLDAIKDFGKGVAGGLRSAINIAKGLPWGTIGDSLKIAGTGAKAVLDAFLALPPWIQGAVLTGWGLNKLSGGALGGIVGELGKGLIKGVLGMNAGVVNIKAGVVTGAGGVPGPAGAAGAAGGAGLGLVTGGLALIGVAGIELLIADVIGKGLRTAVTGTDAPLTTDHVVANLGPVEIGLFRSQKQELIANNAKLKEIAENTNSGSPDDRQARTDAKTAQTKLDTLRDKIETNRIAISSKVQSGTYAVQSGSREIVAAIHGIKFPTTLSVTVNGSGSPDDRGHQTSTVRLGGGGGRRAKG